ncbi:MAG: MazG nucleotide pyrophosphohydrolase domain-containing protein [Deltaproteobacteria bacterium]|nr:MazG nucleotide pyrophosphohydrolase domain-containing protein [Deltaproteobacteria bacterium]
MTQREGGSGGPASLLDGLPATLSPMARAREAQARAARAGFDWPDSLSNLAKVEEETLELREAIRLADAPAVSEEIGDLLLALVNLARAEGHEAERCLAAACEKFERRFRALETRLREQGRTVEQATPAELDAIWNVVKSGEEGR